MIKNFSKFSENELLEKILKLNELDSFNPMQEKVLSQKLFNSNIVVSAPTASGKTLVSEIAALNSIINNRKKVVYTCPLRALANEHYTEFKRKYSDSLNIQATISTGDFDSSSRHLKNYDIIFVTHEKLDSLQRHNADWLQDVGLLILDEIHDLDSGRGPTLEIVTTKFLFINPKIQILALSATIPNANDIAKWLNAELIESDYRPVKLKEGVFFQNEITYNTDSEELISHDDSLSSIITDTLEIKKKQALVFTNTRRNAEASAKKLSEITHSLLTEKEKSELAKASEKILDVLEAPTEQCKKIAELLKNGSCFHHAGLMQKQRTIIEDAFKKNYLKVISATPTLCVSPATEIWQGISSKPVSELKSDDSLLALSDTYLTNITPVEINKNFNTSNLIEVLTTSGFSTAVTPNHRLPIKRNGKKMMLKAKDCIARDKIATIGHIKQDKITNPKFDDFVKENSTDSKIEFSETAFYFIGAMLGDGYSGAEKINQKIIYKGSPCIVGIDNEIFLRVKQFCKNNRIYFKSRKNYYGTPTLVLSKSKWFREFLVNCGVGKGADKKVSKKLMFAEKSLLVALLQGIFDTDGYVQGKKEIGFSNISKDLIFNVKKLLLAFGIVSRIRLRKANKIKIFKKSYNTKPCYELLISQKESIKKFSDCIGFSIIRKQKSLKKLVDSIDSNIHFVECPICNYKIYGDLFEGRTHEQKKWGRRKFKVINYLGNKQKADSLTITKSLGFLPYKKETSLNHHFELISRIQNGHRKDWKLNEIGTFIYKKYLSKKLNIDSFFKENLCPICESELVFNIKNGWRTSDFEGDVFWDFIKSVKKVSGKEIPFVYDVVLPSDGSNNHLFVADGILVHNSAGVNLPSHTVVISSVYRYADSGMEKIPVRDYAQMAGRAGRPKYDTEGRAVMIAKNSLEAEDLFERYVNGSVEEVSSHLGIESVLRIHLLSLIANNFVFDLESMEKFFSKTFYANQFGNLNEIYSKLQSLLLELQEMEFVTADEKYFQATKLGKRVSELYLDPKSAHKMIIALKKQIPFTPETYLFSLSDTSEFFPWLNVPKNAEPELWEFLQEDSSKIPVDLEREIYSDQNLLRKYYLSLLLNDWISEKREQDLMKQYNIQPGILYAKIQIAEWLCYSMSELSKLIGMQTHIPNLGKMQKRLKYGVKEELLILTELKGIGRARARALKRAGFESIAKIKQAPIERLSEVIGSKTAQKLKLQLRV